MRLCQATISAESVFGDDEPVVGSRPLLDGATIPLFGATTVWDFNGVVRRPANLAPCDWRVNFSAELAVPYWNLMARELAMIALNPQHPAVTAAGASRRPKPAAVSTLVRSLAHLRRVARWAGEHQMPPLAAWREDDLRRFIDSLDGKVVRSTIRSLIDLFRDLHELRQVLSCGGVQVDPWRGKTARQAAGVVRAEGLSTPVVPPGQWFSLIRAAWTYVHVFAPDILRARQRYQELLADAQPSAVGFEKRLEEWLADRTNRIPVHVTARSGGTADAPRPNYSLLARLLGVDRDHETPAFGASDNAARRRRAMVQRALTAGHPTIPGLIDDLTQVTRPDGTTGAWHPGFGPHALHRELRYLRNACFTLVAGLSMMRDSEIHEITKGSLVEHYGTPAIASIKQKHVPNLPIKHWWITEPVAEAIVVAEQLSDHPERVFVPIDVMRDSQRVRGAGMLDSFIRHVNATREWTGLEAIPAGKVRPHMFRRTMAMLTDQFAGSEIALGIQLKHVATRALANRCTQGYAASDAAWAEHLDSAIDAARFRRLEDLYRAHKGGEAIGYGPAADRMADVFAHIHQTAQARGGDTTVERTLLRKARISIRFGALNHCAFDETNPAGACAWRTRSPHRDIGGPPDRCRPDRCANSILSPHHIPIWDSERRTLLTLVNNPGLPTCRKAVLQRELADVEAVLRKANPTTTKGQP